MTFIRFEKSKDPDRNIQLEAISYFNAGESRIIITMSQGTIMVINFYNNEDTKKSLEELKKLVTMKSI